DEAAGIRLGPHGDVGGDRAGHLRFGQREHGVAEQAARVGALGLGHSRTFGEQPTPKRYFTGPQLDHVTVYAVQSCLRHAARVLNMADTAADARGAVKSSAATQDAVTKAVIPAAGLGTRFLPATKATPKEILPVIDTPTIQYIVEEAVSAGLRDVLMITGRG